MGCMVVLLCSVGEPMMKWLHEHLSQSEAPGFFWPYLNDGGGIAPEPWHLSYGPVAQYFEQSWSSEMFLEYIANAELYEKEEIATSFGLLNERFIAPSLAAAGVRFSKN